MGRSHHIPAATAADVVALVNSTSRDGNVDVILVGDPMPADQRTRVFEAIRPIKDVDGVAMASFAAMALGEIGLRPWTLAQHAPPMVTER
jgi:methylenetetrahydrofolate dehydrogenase (NADP+) / methenyltetrahydrofolate cyclohydrolase